MIAGWIIFIGTPSSIRRIWSRGFIAPSIGWPSVQAGNDINTNAFRPGRHTRHSEIESPVTGAPLQARQVWWVLAVASAAGACAVAGFARASWRWLVAAALLALPFVVGAPKLQGDALAGFGPEAHAALEQLGAQFIWATTWVSLSFWVCMGLAGGWAFQRWVRPALLAVLQRTEAPVVGAVQAPQ